jgi:alpha-L-rhamnosidase
LSKGEADYWNSGKIMSDQSIHIIYAGKKLSKQGNLLLEGNGYHQQGNYGFYRTAFWTTGLINKNDWQAKWIGYDHGSSWDSITQFSRLSARYFRKPFQSAGAVKSATAYIVGLGLYELYINGKKSSAN